MDLPRYKRFRECERPSHSDSHSPAKRLPSIVAVFATTVVFLCSVFVLSRGLPLGHDQKHHHHQRSPLHFTENGTFQISIFEDLHFGENAWEWWGPAQDEKSLQVMNSILDTEPQQLVVLNGDLITGENTYLSNSTTYIDQIVSPMVKRNLPWASTYGNHDSQHNLSRAGILARERLYNEALTTQSLSSPSAGITNYYLPIYPSTCPPPPHPCPPSLILWFFDSRGGNEYQTTTPSNQPLPLPNWVDQTTVNWFKRTSQNLHKTHAHTIPSLAFVHIPPKKMLDLQLQPGINPHYNPGTNDDQPLAAQGQHWCADGSYGENCGHGGQDAAFAQAMAETAGLMAVFVAHDHGDGWCVRWQSDSALVNSTSGSSAIDAEAEDAGDPVGFDWTTRGLDLCFGQRTGYGGYGHWMRGSRQVLVSEMGLAGGEIESWIRLENGEVVGRVGLNGSFGGDWYPRVPERKSGLGVERPGWSVWDCW
ncbi:hypothetical protein MBLNU230_g5557t1 [Neophaeotheca triangularis]